jgi:hypothetical protein
VSQSGQPQSLRDLWYSYSPTYLQGYAGQRYGYTLAVMWDTLGDAMAYAVRARFPDCCPSDALPYLAIDRQIDRGPNEAEASYRARLKLWLDLWRHAGSARSVITALEVWFGGTYEIETVAQSQAVGTAWDVYNPATQQITHQLVSPANWTWDDTGVAPRAWVIVQGGGYSPTTEAYGSGSTWGNGEVFGISGSPGELAPWLRNQIRKWSSAGGQVPWIIMSWDPTWFQPTSPANKLPDASYGDWAKVDTIAGVRVYVAARTPNASYINGPQ